MFSLRANFAKLITALLWVQHANTLAVDLENGSSDIEARAPLQIQVQPCLSSGAITAPRGSMVAAAKGLKAAPWFPNCFDIPNENGRNACLACFAKAGVVYGAAVLGCTTASVACLLVQPECEATCVAIASYNLWSQEQACYCEHTDCSDPAVRAKGKIGSPPELVIGGGHFTTSPHLFRGDNVDLKFVYPPRGATLNCYTRGCETSQRCRGGSG
ncbi:hypothetical protein ACJZ2D_006570 [Fusarium nematophilum]